MCQVVAGAPVTLWRARDRRLAAAEGRGAKKRKKMSPGSLKADSGAGAVGTAGMEHGRWASCQKPSESGGFF